jgi:hypothetical protein
MKTNLKGNGGIKRLLLLHGEKLLIAVVAIAAGFLVYRALGVERLTDQYQADKLLAKVRETRSSIQDPRIDWNRIVQEHPDKVRLVRDVDKKSDAFDVPPDYATVLEGVNPPVIVQSDPRTDPSFLPAVAVYGHSGVGRLAFIDEATQQREALRQAREAAEKEQEAKRQAKEEQDFGNPTRRGSRTPRRGGRGEDATRRGGDEDYLSRRGTDSAGLTNGVKLTGGELVELSRWVCVVAKVPVRAQFNAYRSAFEKARGGYVPSAEFPEYLGFGVERAEVIAGQAALNWQEVPVYDAKGTPTRQLIWKEMVPTAIKKLSDLAATEWANSLQEDVVDPSHLDPQRQLIYPLPPLVGREWGADATHPDIPLAKDIIPDEYAVIPADDGVVATPVAGDDEGFGAAADTGFGMRDERRYSRGESFGRDGGFRGGFRDRGGINAYSRERAGRGGAGAQIPLEANVNDWLLRFYDFTVAPGKKYTYRVQLMVRDPNQAAHVTPSMLDSAVNDRIKKLDKGPDGRPLPKYSFQRTNWSDPSPPVGVPLDGSVRVEEIRATAGVQLSDEPRVKLLVQAFGRDSKSGELIEAAQEKEFIRGGVANFQETAEYVSNDGTKIEKADYFPFLTGITVVDMRGGERLGKDVLASSRVLLMDPAGGLSIRSEENDEREVKAHRDMFTKKKPADARTDPTRRSARGG